MSSIDVGTHPHGLAISADGRVASVDSQHHEATAITVLARTALKETAKMQLDKIPGGLNLGPYGRQISFAVAGVDTLLALETVTNRTGGLIARGVSPHVVPLAPDGRVVLVVNQGPIEFSLIEPTNNMVSATLKVGKAPYWLAVSADGRTAYVANEGSNDASVVDLDSRQGTVPIRAVMLHAKERCSRWYGLVTSPHQAVDRGFPGTGWPGNL